jgi:ribosomal protein L11 methyltransferase
MDYYAYHFHTAEGMQEPLLGLLSQLPFESFQEEEEALMAYLPANIEPESLHAGLEEIRQIIPFQLVVERLETQNWNELWESNFSPVQVGGFCGIRAEFHPPFGDAVRHELVIQPRMAFGTGHHETTWMMIQFMEELHFQDARVLDYGAGTGILAILAARLGAKTIDALEIETIACENARDNCLRNGAPSVRVIEGTLDLVKDRHYDIALANINRHVLLDSFLPLYTMLPPRGVLLISGILQADRELIEQALREAGFLTEEVRSRGQWIAVKALRV